MTNEPKLVATVDYDDFMSAIEEILQSNAQDNGERFVLGLVKQKVAEIFVKAAHKEFKSQQVTL